MRRTSAANEMRQIFQGVRKGIQNVIKGTAAFHFVKHDEDLISRSKLVTCT